MDNLFIRRLKIWLDWFFFVSFLVFVLFIWLTGFFYYFEFIVRSLIKLSPILYAFLIIPIFGITYTLYLFLYRYIIVFLISLRKTARPVVSMLFTLLSIVAIVVFTILMNTNIIDFSWEGMRYAQGNRLIFSVMMIALVIANTEIQIHVVAIDKEL